MGQKQKIITCIYCKEQKVSSKEHAVQRSMGGNLTIPVVCRDCNTGFSKIDKSLAEKSLLSLIRVVEQETDAATVDLGGTHFWTPPGEETLEIQVGYRLEAKLKPQLMFQVMGETTQMRSCVESAAGYQTFIQAIREWIRLGKIDTIPILSPPINQPKYTLPRLVLHKSKDLFFRAPEGFPCPKEFLAKVVYFLKNNIDRLDDGIKESLKTAKVQTNPNPQIVVTASITLNDIYRAIAKIAFNLLAEKEGADFVLRAEFDSIRNYIRGIDVQNRQPNDPSEIAYDPRFVQMVPAGEQPPFPRSAQRSHTALLFYSYPMLFAGLDFYGQQYYVIRLAETELDRQILYVHSFDYVKKSNSPLSIQEIAERIQASLLDTTTKDGIKNKLTE